jgi:GTP-binding protein EngB required for normal cell division
MPSYDFPERARERRLISSQDGTEFVSELAERYQLASTRPLLEVCKASGERSDLSIAVIGRFKAGKSSFLNHLIGQNVLPVGVIPVTSVVTDVGLGAEDRAIVRFTGGRKDEIPVQDVRLYVTEAENPLNRKHVESVSVRLAALSRWPDLKFIDTPGLESAFAHNTGASIGWAPNVDVALVAIGVDPPLSVHDLALIEMLFRYTPRIAILLTKADVLEEKQLEEVHEFVRRQIEIRFKQDIPIFPYSTRPGFERFKLNIEDTLLKHVAMDAASQRRAISNRKMATLLRDCEQYLQLTFKSAEMLDNERLTLQKQLWDERGSLADTRLEVKLIAKHAVAGTRSSVERALAPYEKPTRKMLLEAFEEEANRLPNSFANLLDAFSDWLHAALSNELLSISGAKRSEFVRPLADVQRQYQRVLQSFRDRLSDRTFTIYGVPLKTTEPEIVPKPPKMPDVNIGRAFDHNWELLSSVLPMSVLRGAVFRRFRNRIADEVFKNLSRLTSQWEEIVTGAILELQREAEKRLEELLETVEGLVSTCNDSAPQIRADLERLETMIAEISSYDDPTEAQSL